jgi:hypothetical protein
MWEARQMRASLQAVHAASVSNDAPRSLLDVCGHAVALGYGGTEAEALFRPALRSIAANGAAAAGELQVHCFVAEEPPGAWLRRLGLSTALYETHQRGTFRYCFQGHTLFAFDAGARRAWYWAENAAAFALYRARPLTRIFAWFAESRGLNWLHAACIGTPRGAVLIPAAGGSGKSTAAVAGLLGGLCFLGDDFCVLDPRRLEVAGLYGTVVLSSASRELLRPVAPLDGLLGGFPEKKGKTGYYLDARFDRQLGRRLPLRGILVPEITSGETAIERAEPELALRAFVSSLQIGRLLGVDPATLLRDAYGAVRKVEAGRLLLGRDLARVAGLVSRFVAAER